MGKMFVFAPEWRAKTSVVSLFSHFIWTKERPDGKKRSYFVARLADKVLIVSLQARKGEYERRACSGMFRIRPFRSMYHCGFLPRHSGRWQACKLREKLAWTSKYPLSKLPALGFLIRMVISPLVACIFPVFPRRQN